MRIVAASLFSILLVALGCNSEPPPPICMPGMQEVAEPGFGFEGLGFPAGGVGCRWDDPTINAAYVAYREGTPEEVAAKVVAHLAAAGWKEMPLPAVIQERNFELAVAGHGPGIEKLFAKDGTQERRYARIAKIGEVHVELYKADCAPKPEGPVDDYCR